MASGHAARLVGEVEIVPLLDAVARLGMLTELYPEAALDDWEPYRPLYPELFAGDVWRVACTCYLVRSAAETILVDTGLGPPGLVDWVLELEGGLPERLADLGVGRDDIDVVFLTHLHIDHPGWNTDERGDVYFPNARYVVHEDALAFALTRTELPHIARCVEPLADRFETIAGEYELDAGIVAVPLAGHYPGHTGLRISSGGTQAVLMADAAVHPALLDHPDWLYISDLDHERSVQTRRELLGELVDSDVLVVCGHYPGSGLGHIRRSGERVVWEAD